MKRLVVVLVVACGSTPKEPTITKEQQTANCRPAVDHLVAIMLRGETGSVPLAERLRTALFDRCQADAWGEDATTCFRSIKLLDQAGSCARFLTVPQRDGFEQAIDSVTR